MATLLSEVSSPLGVDHWQLDKIRTLFRCGGLSIEEIVDHVNLDPLLVHEVIEISYLSNSNNKIKTSPLSPTANGSIRSKS